MPSSIKSYFKKYYSAKISTDPLYFVLLFVLGIFLANPGNVIFINIPFSESVRVGFPPLINILGGLLFGPALGAILAGLLDIVNMGLWYGMEDFHIAFTLAYMLRGFLAGYIYHYRLSRFSFWNVLLVIAVANSIVTAFAVPLIITTLYEAPFGANVKTRVLIQFIIVPLYALIGYFILQGKKKNEEMVRMHGEMETMLKIDDLTGISNRRYFMTTLRTLTNDHQKTSTPLALIIADLDRFKAINDTFGHQVGDTVLKEIATLILKESRRNDIVARIGGEEFAILLPESTAAEAYSMAERMREKIARCHIPPVEHITISLGVAELEKGESSDSFFSRSDKALYKAKRAGRNKTKLY